MGTNRCCSRSGTSERAAEIRRPPQYAFDQSRAVERLFLIESWKLYRRSVGDDDQNASRKSAAFLGWQASSFPFLSFLLFTTSTRTKAIAQMAILHAIPAIGSFFPAWDTNAFTFKLSLSRAACKLSLPHLPRASLNPPSDQQGFTLIHKQSSNKSTTTSRCVVFDPITSTRCPFFVRLEYDQDEGEDDQVTESCLSHNHDLSFWPDEASRLKAANAVSELQKKLEKATAAFAKAVEKMDQEEADKRSKEEKRTRGWRYTSQFALGEEEWGRSAPQAPALSSPTGLPAARKIRKKRSEVPILSEAVRLSPELFENFVNSGSADSHSATWRLLPLAPRLSLRRQIEREAAGLFRPRLGRFADVHIQVLEEPEAADGGGTLGQSQGVRVVRRGERG